ncbi:dephospho-CoA kinase domain-containing protein-like [Crassostrea angulata]|uniref:Dephospho-CoA kinase domain-containing protein n=1 Tax=Magallana gigas TaxID=29159 RepID=K1RUC6_MAGGI|nr:dephospho-CoA kinase domain-containing protein-like [Crassostrea angulata]|eukprot:XP_011425266.1 PREDICTED: dephospho-CoA kinase domain-containing protein [Crassostrea gigas]
MFLVGLTGGIASGKSTVARILKEDLGCVVIDADVVAREVVQPGTNGWKKIRQHFGSDVFLPNGELNREKLGQVIFNDAEKRKVLNSITHPEIYKAIAWKVVKNFLLGQHFIILDLPLLFESKKMVPFMSYTVVVNCSEEQQVQRLMARNQYSKEAAEIRIQAQMPLSEKCGLCTRIIDNSKDMKTTYLQTVQLHKELSKSLLYWKVRMLIALCAGSVIGLTIYVVKCIFR